MAGMERPTPGGDEKEPTTPLRESHALEDDELVKRTQELLDGESGHEHSSIRTVKRNPANTVDEDGLDLEEDELEEGDVTLTVCQMPLYAVLYPTVGVRKMKSSSITRKTRSVH
jgi:hypothetical protein